MKRRDFFKILTGSAAGIALGRVPGLTQSAPSDSMTLSAATTAAPGAKPIRIGVSAPFSGTQAAYGVEFYRGAQAHWLELNTQGGIQGRPVEQFALDDAGDPYRAISNTRQLLEEFQVDILSNFVGEASLMRVAPLLDSHPREDVVLVGHLAGGRLKSRADRVFNIRASYEQEVETLVAELWRLGVRRMGLYWQGDASGKPAHTALFEALDRRGAEPVAELTYLPGRPVFDGLDAYEHFQSAGAEVVFFAVPQDVIADLLAPAREMGWPGLGVVLSAVDAAPLLRSLEELAAGSPVEYTDHLVCSQVVPSPLDDRFPLVNRYVELMAKWNPAPPPTAEDGYHMRQPGAISLEGFLNARVISRALSLDARTGLGMRETFEQLEPYDVGLDQLVRLDNQRRQGFDGTYLTAPRDGDWQPLGSLERLAFAGRPENSSEDPSAREAALQSTHAVDAETVALGEEVAHG